MEGPRIVQQCDGKAEKRLAKAMHREARKCNGIAQLGEATRRLSLATRRSINRNHDKTKKGGPYGQRFLL